MNEEANGETFGERAGACLRTLRAVCLVSFAASLALGVWFYRESRAEEREKRAEPQRLAQEAARQIDGLLQPVPKAVTERPQPISYRLDAPDLKALTAVAAPDPTADRPAPPNPPQPSVSKQLEEMLGSLLDIDYPTEAHFRNVLRLAHCAYYQRTLRDAARKRAVVVEADDACPTQMPAQAPDAAASAPMRLAAFYRALMPPELTDRIVKQARKPHPPDARFDAGWTATPGCGCVPPNGAEEVYGFVPYWGTTEQQQASPPPAPASAPAAVAHAPAPRQVDFSLFSRLSFFGAMLNDLGGFDLPPEVSAMGHRLAHDAQRHGTGVDLVVHRSEWDTLLERRSQEDLKRLAERAADSAMQLVDARQTNQHEALQTWLLPFWREEPHAYGGITVFFDNVPADGSATAAPYEIFRNAFVDGLIRKMQESGRRYRLNVVVPDHRLADQGMYAFDQLTQLIEKAEPARTSKKVDANEKMGLYRGTTDITVNYLVLLSDPTTDTKKALRTRIEKSEEVKGARRVSLLESMLPMLLRPPAGKPPWARQAPGAQFDDDLAYIKWNYGGLVLWELPAQALGDKDRLKMLQDNYRDDTRRLPALCDAVCPQRLWLRLLLQALALVGAISIPLWFYNCTVRAWGLPYKIYLWAGGLIAVGIALALNECDPALQELSESYWPLIGVVASLFAGGLYYTFRRRRERP